MFPEVNELAEVLFNYVEILDPDTELDVRLQVTEDDWQVHSGDPQYDTDHRGFWGYGTMNAAHTKADCMEMARFMIEEAQEQQAVSGEGF